MIQNFQLGISTFKAKGEFYQNLFEIIKSQVIWDISMKSRKTASFGRPYSYSNIDYEFSMFPNYVEEVINDIEGILGYRPNNCLLNYYDNSNSSMGFHSDRTDILIPSTGITILSLGKQRIMRFKNKLTGEIKDTEMKPKWFLHMSSDLQEEWLHAILPVNGIDVDNERISLTFRCLSDL